MKQTVFTFLILSAIGLASCRKSSNELDIKGYDRQQIQTYITNNGLNGMVRDTSGGDTTGIYYQIINPGDPTKRIDYPDQVSFVYTIKSFDNKFAATDTVLNHYYGYVGHITPNGLVLALRNILKYKGAKARFLIPSHLAYGVNGAGSGSKTLTTGRIAGNQCLDYTINLIDNQQVYDDLVINNYLTANNLTGYIKTESVLAPHNYYYYKIVTPGTGTDPITLNSTVTCNYRGSLLNGTDFDNAHVTNTYPFNDLTALVYGVQEALQKAKVGTAISIIIPSALGYGTNGGTGLVAIPANACLRFEYTITAVTP